MHWRAALNRRAGILAGLLLAGALSWMPAEEGTTAAILGPARTPAEVVSRFASAGLDREDAAADICRDRDATRILTVHLVAAGPATRRQALAHALDCWWAVPPGRAEKAVLTRADTLPAGQRSAGVHPTGLHGRPGLIPLVRAAMAPWLGGDAATTSDPATGQWSASLDSDGHARLIELLSILQHPEPLVPPLVPDAGSAIGGRRSQESLQATTWGGLAQRLAAAYHLSTALAGTIPPDTPCQVDLPAGPLNEVPALLAPKGIQAAVLRGALCLGRTPPDDREHPAARRRLAVLPIAHLATRRGDDALIASIILRRVDPAGWKQPGWTIIPLDDPHCLIVAADTATIHHVVAALAAIEHHGLNGPLPGTFAGSPTSP